MGSAAIQGQLWSASPQDWAEVGEPQMWPVHQAAVDALAPLAGQALLDAGCGSGQLLRLAAAAGATVSGLDASAALLGVARGQLPDADLRTGDIGELPYDDSGFDVVTAFNAIQYAADPKTAVAELARVTRPGGRVLIGVWAEPERCETEVLFARLRELAPPPPGTAAPLAVSAPGVVEDLMTTAGLLLASGGEASCPFIYPDVATAWRGMSAAGPLQKVIQLAGLEATRAVCDDVHGQYQQPDGTIRQENVFRYVVARKPA
jgi:SAM-dependent methyltransferase